jgi:hypothetical protein
MKKIYLLGLAMSLFTMAKAQTTVITDDFESRPTGSLFTGFWSNWSQSDNADLNLMVVNNRAFSGSKSGFVGPQNASNGQDVLLVMPELYNKGTVTTQWKMYVPADSVGYFNVQALANPGDAYAFDCFVNTFTTTDTLADGTNLASKIVWTFSDGTSSYYYAYAPITTNSWFTLKQVMNFDSGITHFYVNDVPVTYYYYGTEAQGGNVWPTADTSMASIDFFSYADDNNPDLYNSYYIDDVTVTTQGIISGIKDVNKNSALVSLFPNPSKDYMNLSIKGGDVMLHVEVYNILGQRVLELDPKAASVKLNLEGFAPGTYTTKVATKNGSFSKEFTVK